MKMIDKNGNTDAAQIKGTLGGPIMLAAALFVFLIAAQVSGLNGWTDEIGLLALPAVAAIGAAFGRISSEHPSGEQPKQRYCPQRFCSDLHTGILFRPRCDLHDFPFCLLQHALYGN